MRMAQHLRLSLVWWLLVTLLLLLLRLLLVLLRLVLVLVLIRLLSMLIVLRVLVRLLQWCLCRLLWLQTLLRHVKVMKPGMLIHHPSSIKILWPWYVLSEAWAIQPRHTAPCGKSRRVIRFCCRVVD